MLERQHNEGGDVFDGDLLQHAIGWQGHRELPLP